MVAVHQIQDQVLKDADSLPSGGGRYASGYRPNPTQVDPHIQVEAIPAPLAPMLWNGLAFTDTGYIYHYTVNTLQGEAVLKAKVPLNLDSPLAMDFLRTDPGRRYLLWTRAPHVQQISHDKILLEDLRYNFVGLESMARPGLLEVTREPDGNLTHRWVSVPLPK
jgi:hypothetical protein